MKKLVIIIALTGILFGCSQEKEITEDWLQGDWGCTLNYFDYNDNLNKYEEGGREEKYVTFKKVKGQFFVNNTAFDLDNKFTSRVHSFTITGYDVTNNIEVKKNNDDEFSFITKSNKYDKTKDINIKRKLDMVCTRIQ